MEVWKDISNYVGIYMISNLGRIESLERKVKNRNGYRVVKRQIINSTKRKDGYHIVTLWKNNNKKSFLLHRLVAQAFIPNPNNLPAVNHIDENPSNNCADNLEWCDDEYNNNYGNHKFRSAATQSQKVNQYDLAGNFIKTWNSMKEIERVLKINHSCISACCKGKQKYSNGYIWKYYENKEK